MVASKIEWTGRSDWNPVRGCTRVSPGCGGPGPHGGCYAEGIAARFSGPGLAFNGFAEKVGGKPHWTGRVEVMWDRLTDPLKWREPATIFALSMSDLFHEKLSVEEIATIYAVAVAAVHVRGHTFQILTKRSTRMREIMKSAAFWKQVNAEAGAHVMEYTDPLARRRDDARATLDEYGPDRPPPGIWIGVSVENQQYADERIPDLLATPAAIRFLSCEPLLGPLHVGYIGWPSGPSRRRDGINALLGHRYEDGHFVERVSKIDWIITGGESGPRARPANPQWFRDIGAQCQSADVPWFHKQNGEYVSVSEMEGPGEHFSFPDGRTVRRVGKARAGALLDGVEHKEMP